MLETNIRIVQPGEGLRLVVRRASLEGPDLSNDLLERACGTLRYRYGLAAIPTGRSGVRELLVAGDRPVPEIVLDGPGWTLGVRDSNQPEEHIHLARPEDRLAISELLERAFLAHLSKQPPLWTLDSPRKWYRREPLETIDGIAAYRRFDVGTIIIDGVGVGIAVDLATAFFTEHTLGFLLGFGLREGERRKRFEYFEHLTGRQSGQKGTLVYDSGRGKSKCYFEDAPEGVTCGTTGPVRIGAEKTYPSLFEYYRSVRPQLHIAQDAPAVRVSFRGIGRPQFVAADRLRVRVMNDDVPRPLDSIDKIDPDRRRAELEEFWQTLGPKPLGHVASGFLEGFWRPDKQHQVRFAMPALRFGHGQELSEVPEWSSADKYRAHYNQRLEYLANSGCYSVPPALGRALYCAYPARLGEDAPRELADLIANKLGIWTGLTFTAELIPYTTVQEAIRELRNCELPGVVIFVLNDEPSAYYEVALQLADWRVKRITERQLARHYRQLTEPRNGGVNNGSSARRGSAAWERFVDMNSLATLRSSIAFHGGPLVLAPTKLRFPSTLDMIGDTLLYLWRFRERMKKHRHFGSIH